MCPLSALFLVLSGRAAEVSTHWVEGRSFLPGSVAGRVVTSGGDLGGRAAGGRGVVVCDEGAYMSGATDGEGIDVLDSLVAVPN